MGGAWWRVAVSGGYSGRQYFDNGRSEVSDLDDGERVTVGDDGKSANGGSKTKTVALRPEKK